MIWTTDKPTVPGWYWYRDENTKDENTYEIIPLAFMVKTSFDGKRLLLWTHLNLYGETEDCRDVTELDGQWAGPILPPPDEPHDERESNP